MFYSQVKYDLCKLTNNSLGKKKHYPPGIHHASHF